MKKQEKVSASDNELTNTITSEKVAEIINKIKTFDNSNGGLQHEQLQISIPIGLFQLDKIGDFISRHTFFDLVYSTKRLRFAIEIAKQSKVKDVKIEFLYKDEKTNLESFVINDPLKLSIGDVRELVRRITDYFQPLYLDVCTIEESHIIPPKAYLSEPKIRAGRIVG